MVLGETRHVCCVIPFHLRVCIYPTYIINMCPPHDSLRSFSISSFSTNVYIASNGRVLSIYVENVLSSVKHDTFLHVFTATPLRVTIIN